MNAPMHETRLRSATREVVIGRQHPFCLIGERINPTGRRIFQDQIKAGDLSAVERDVKSQVEGGADVLDVKGPGDFVARLFIDGKTHLPVMLSWQGRPPPARGRGPGGPPRGGPTPAGPPAGGPPAAGAAPAGGPPPVENRLYFAEYRSFDGLQLPTRVRRAVAGDTTEETTFDRFRINARVDPRRFEPGS